VTGGLKTSAENYFIAWDLLKHHYEDKRLIMNNHLTKLLNFPAVVKNQYNATMKQLVVHIRTHLKALQVLGQPTDKWDTIIIHMAKNKLDFRLQHAWEEEVSQRGTDYMPAMEEFLQFLSEKCRTWQMLDNRGKEESHLKGNATSFLDCQRGIASRL